MEEISRAVGSGPPGVVGWVFWMVRGVKDEDEDEDEGVGVVRGFVLVLVLVLLAWVWCCSAKPAHVARVL